MKSMWRWKTLHTKSEYCFCASSRDLVPDRGRLEKLLLSFYLHELSTPADHLTEFHACCELLKEKGRGGPIILKVQKLWTAQSARAMGSVKLSGAQEGSSQLPVKAWDWQSFCFWEECDGKTKNIRCRNWGSGTHLESPEEWPDVSWVIWLEIWTPTLKNTSRKYS